MRHPVLTLTLLLAVGVSLAAPIPKAPADTPRVVSNPAKDLHVVTDKDESLKEFFNRTPVLLGMNVQEKGAGSAGGLDTLLAAKEPVTVFVSYPSANDRKYEGLFGANLKVAPPTEEVVKLLKPVSGKPLDLLFRIGEGGVYHVVGYTTRGKLDFFGDEKVNKQDGYSLKDLRLAPKK